MITGDENDDANGDGSGERSLDAAAAPALVCSPNAESAGECRLLRSSDEILPVRTRDCCATENPLPWDIATEYAEGREEVVEPREPMMSLRREGAEPVEPWMEGPKFERMEWREPCSDGTPTPWTSCVEKTMISL